jgi:hypothetical protein
MREEAFMMGLTYLLQKGGRYTRFILPLCEDTIIWEEKGD